MWEDDTSTYFESMCRAFVKMADAKDENEVTRAFGSALSACQDIAKEAYARVGRSRVSEVISDTHDDAVRAAGGQ